VPIFRGYTWTGKDIFLAVLIIAIGLFFAVKVLLVMGE